MEHNVQHEKDFQLLIGNLLRYGVWLALGVALFGGIVYLLHHSAETVDYSTFTENDRSIFTVISDVLNGVTNFDGASIIFLGVILLFLTPVFRMLLSLWTFIIEKDRTYIFITSLVIAIICMSVALGFSH